MSEREREEFREEPLARSYCLKVWVEGAPDPLVYGISRDRADAFRTTVFNYDDRELRHFVWTTPDGREVALNLQALELANILWESKASEEPAKNQDEEPPILIRFRSGREPCGFHTDDPKQLAQIYWNMEHGVEHDGVFQLCLDEDGEELAINTRMVSVLEAPADLVAEGEEEIAKEG